eukprot:CAMPEP_0115575616 /NCGR_PEP_ID=MMETSP0272-20121206/2132_1 /TAXON_ID=71861 /ORGANISM="Scrippsiella trochoidea, Strain CCMP3099" /LENGTH=90 /DNA_ID=CAMNT_0003010369 /DNA_START=638 /DNA_END=909 /DNA_ORIENTATION=+
MSPRTAFAARTTNLAPARLAANSRAQQAKRQPDAHAQDRHDVVVQSPIAAIIHVSAQTGTRMLLCIALKQTFANPSANADMAPMKSILPA